MVRLVDLAHDLHETDGPIGEMDGTPESLLALWQWHREQEASDFPTLPIGTRADHFVAIHDDPTYDSRWGYAGETLAHYVAMVIRGYVDDVAWKPRPIPKKNLDAQQNEPMLVGTGMPDLMAEDIGIGAARSAHEHTQASSDADLLRKRFESWLGVEFWAGPRRTPYALSDLLETPRALADDPRRIVPVLSRAPEPVADGRAPRGRTITLEPKAKGTVIDPNELRDALAPDCTVARGGDLDVNALVSGFDLEYHEGSASLTASVADGQIVGIIIQPLNMTDDEWAQFKFWLAALNARLQLKAIYEDEQ